VFGTFLIERPRNLGITDAMKVSNGTLNFVYIRRVDMFDSNVLARPTLKPKHVVYVDSSVSSDSQTLR